MEGALENNAFNPPRSNSTFKSNVLALFSSLSPGEAMLWSLDLQLRSPMKVYPQKDGFVPNLVWKYALPPRVRTKLLDAEQL